MTACQQASSHASVKSGQDILSEQVHQFVEEIKANPAYKKKYGDAFDCEPTVFSYTTVMDDTRGYQRFMDHLLEIFATGPNGDTVFTKVLPNLEWPKRQEESERLK